MNIREPQPQPTASPPPRPFQFSLRTLLLLFVVLGLSMAVFGAWGVLVFGLAVGLAIYLRLIKPLWPLVCLVATVGLVVGLQPTVGGPRVVGRRAACRNHLRQIMLALQDYHQVNGCFPPAYIADKDGKPVHSWRTLILPYLDRMDLYKEYDFNEPWDGPHNKRLLRKRPKEFACPSDPIADMDGAAQTSYVAVVGTDAAWAGEKPRRANEFSSLSHSIMLVEVANSEIEWTEPRDLSLNTLGEGETKSAPLIVSSNHGHSDDFFFAFDKVVPSVHVAMGDGSTDYLRLGRLSNEELREILQVGACTTESRVSLEARLDEGCAPTGPTSPPSPSGCSRSACCWSALCGAGRRGLPEVAATT